MESGQKNTAEHETGRPATPGVGYNNDDARLLQRIVSDDDRVLAGHLFVTASATEPAHISVGGKVADRSAEKKSERDITGTGLVGEETSQFPQHRCVPLMEQEEDTEQRLPSPYPAYPTPADHRVPLPYEPQGYMHILPREDQSWRDKLLKTGLDHPTELGDLQEQEEELIAEQTHGPPAGDYVSDEAFEKLVEDFRGGDGKFLAMTAYGAVPLPEQMLQSIPEKFVTKPLVQVMFRTTPLRPLKVASCCCLVGTRSVCAQTRPLHTAHRTRLYAIRTSFCRCPKILGYRQNQSRRRRYDN